jgi:hypothetical protein
MKCFDHPETDAVAVCMVCGKGCCRACAADLGRVVCCKGRCEVEARRMTDLRDFSFAQPSMTESRMKWAAAAQTRGAAFIMLLGAAFMAFGALNPQFRIVIGLGALFSAYGLWILVRGRRRDESNQFRLCPHCGYNITGNTTGKCPECGKFF